MARSASAEVPAKKNNISKFADTAGTSELKALGFRVDKVERGFIAAEIHGDRRFGPATSASALTTLVKVELDKEKKADGTEQPQPAAITEPEGDVKEAPASDAPAAPEGNGRVPKKVKVTKGRTAKGDDFLFEEMRPTQQKKNKQLEKVGEAYETAKLARVAATKVETETKKALDTAAGIHKEDFAFHPDTGEYIYVCESGTEVVIETMEKVITRPQTEEQ